MGLGKLFTRQRTSDADELRAAGANFQVVIDGTPVNYPMSVYRGGMSVPGAWRSASLISNLIGGLPWQAYRERAGNPVELVEPTPMLLEQPSPPDTRMTTFSSWALDLVWHGNALGIIAARNAAGVPTGVLPIPANQVGIRRVGWEAVSQLPIGAIEYQIGGRTFGSNDVLHVKGPCEPGELRGLGVLEAHMDSLDLAHEQRKQAGSISQHGVPTGILKVTNPDATRASLLESKDAWLKSQRERSIAVLNATTEFTPLSWNPEELELVEARKFTNSELSLIFGLPASFLNVETSSRVYSNIEQESINLLRYCIGGHLERFEQTLSLLLPRGTRVKANLDAMLRSDTKTRYEAHSIALDKGILTLDEVRELEDRPPLPESEKPPAPLQLLPNQSAEPNAEEA